jgi:hypothetical protein
MILVFERNLEVGLLPSIQMYSALIFAIRVFPFVLHWVGLNGDYSPVMIKPMKSSVRSTGILSVSCITSLTGFDPEFR